MRVGDVLSAGKVAVSLEKREFGSLILTGARGGKKSVNMGVSGVRARWSTTDCADTSSSQTVSQAAGVQCVAKCDVVRDVTECGYGVAARPTGGGGGGVSGSHGS